MPGIRITKRDDMSKGKATFVKASAILLSIIFAGLFIRILGYNPVEVLANIINGALGTKMRFEETIIKAIPLTITSLGILIAFKMKFWNIGGEGQIMMGAFGAALIALRFGDLSKPLLLLLMAAAAMLAGGIWAFIPAFFKIKFGTNETIFTLMLNYIAIKWVTYLQFGPWKDPTAQGFPKIPTFSNNAILPKLFGIHIGWVIALVFIVLVYVLINHTKKGFEISVVGESVNTARYAGINVGSVVIFSMFISGGLCGLAGMIQASAIEKTLTVSLSGGYGFTAIITTWLSGLSAPLVLVTSFCFAILIQGGNFVQISLSMPSAVSNMLQGMILFFILGSVFFTRYKIEVKKVKKGGEEHA